MDFLFFTINLSNRYSRPGRTNSTMASEIIVDCGVNRKTFYYHFEDIYAPLKWMLEEEAGNVVK